MTHHSTRQTPLRTLALDPGTREMGYAVLEGTELLYFGVHAFRQRTSTQHLLAEGQPFVTHILQTFAPRLFVIEKTHYTTSKRSPLLHEFVEAMQCFAKQHHLLVRAYAPTAVKKAITGHGAATRRQVAETLIEHGYPYLAKYLQIDLRTREKYWEHMFNAVAVGLTGCEEVSKQQRQRKRTHPIQT